MPRLENWSATTDCQNEFLAPELMSKRLHGNVYGHPRFMDGMPVNTSTLEEFDCKNKLVKTRSGTEYELGTMSKEYQEYLEENNITWRFIKMEIGEIVDMMEGLGLKIEKNVDEIIENLGIINKFIEEYKGDRKALDKVLIKNEILNRVEEKLSNLNN
jgi:hypothetical protein